ncbi:MAG TPA: YHS domain-containing protein [Anaerolineales bacterium]|jgi:Cu+-exporting ATPase|nr:YHS domain-containing protein [Anaerolineales bacterium]
MAIDPVCGMQVDENAAAATYEFKGKTYYFCAPGCKADFEKDPEKYLGRGQAQQPPEGHAGHH